MKMDSSNQFSIFPPGGVTPPNGLNAIMQGLVREVLMKNPKDIFLFAAEYFDKLIEIRRNASSDENVEISDLIYIHQNSIEKPKTEDIVIDISPKPYMLDDGLVVECLENKKESKTVKPKKNKPAKIDKSTKSVDKKINVKNQDHDCQLEAINNIQNTENRSESMNKDDFITAFEKFDESLLPDVPTKDEIITYNSNEMQENATQNIESPKVHLENNIELVHAPDCIENQESSEKNDPTYSSLEEKKDEIEHSSVSKDIDIEINKDEPEIKDDIEIIEQSEKNSQVEIENKANSLTIEDSEHVEKTTCIEQNIGNVEPVLEKNINISDDKEKETNVQEETCSVESSILEESKEFNTEDNKTAEENISQTETIEADYTLAKKLDTLNDFTEKCADEQNENNEEKEKEIKKGSSTEQEKDIFEKASVVIQKIFRGFMARNKVSRMLKNKKNQQIEEKNDGLNDFTEPINQIIRANIEPVLYTVPEEKNGSYSTEEESSTFSSAATKIQAGVRGFLTRKYFQHTKTNTSSDTTAPSIGDDSKSLEEIVGTFDSNSGDDPVSKIIVATSSILIEQLEHFEKLENNPFQSTMSHVDSIETSKDGEDSKRKRLKREDAIQLNSPYNSSGETSANKYTPNKLSEDEEPIGDLAQSIISEIISNSFAQYDKITQGTAEIETAEIQLQKSGSIKDSKDDNEKVVENSEINDENKNDETVNESAQELEIVSKTEKSDDDVNKSKDEEKELTEKEFNEDVSEKLESIIQNEKPDSTEKKSKDDIVDEIKLIEESDRKISDEKKSSNDSKENEAEQDGDKEVDQELEDKKELESKTMKSTSSSKENEAEQDEGKVDQELEDKKELESETMKSTSGSKENEAELDEGKEVDQELEDKKKLESEKMEKEGSFIKEEVNVSLELKSTNISKENETDLKEDVQELENKKELEAGKSEKEGSFINEDVKASLELEGTKSATEDEVNNSTDIGYKKLQSSDSIQSDDGDVVIGYRTLSSNTSTTISGDKNNEEASFNDSKEKSHDIAEKTIVEHEPAQEYSSEIAPSETVENIQIDQLKDDTIESAVGKDDKKNQYKGMIHSGEFHDVLLPTKIVKRPSTIEKD